jgi:GTPase SAR1 family protein
MSITYSHKVILLGDICVGKTTIFDKILYEKTTDTYSPTIGVDYGTRTYAINPSVNIKLRFWDTAGQERFESIVSIYYNTSNIVMFVYDAKRPETFNNIETWIHKYLEKSRPPPGNYANNIYLYNEMSIDNLIASDTLSETETDRLLHSETDGQIQNNTNKLFFLIENKCDLVSESEAIPEHQINKLVKKYNMHYFKMSATSFKSSTYGVENVFNQIVQTIYDKYSNIYIKHKNLDPTTNNTPDHNNLMCCNIL